MINIPQGIKKLLEEDSVAKNFRVNFPNGEFRDLVNADFVSESVIFTESLNSSADIKFGICEGASLEFQTYFTDNLIDLQIKAGIELDVSNAFDTDIAVIPVSQFMPGTYAGDVQYPITKTGTYMFISRNRVLRNIEYGAEEAFPESGTDYDYIKLDLLAGQTITINVMGNIAATDYMINITINKSDYPIPPEDVQESSDVPYPFYHIPYGTFFIDSCKLDSVSNIRKVIAYQYKHNAENEIYSGLKNIIRLSAIDRLKFDLRTIDSTYGENKFYFFYLMAYAHALNSKDFIFDYLYREYLNLPDKQDYQFNSRQIDLTYSSRDMAYLGSAMNLDNYSYKNKLGIYTYQSPEFLITASGYTLNHSYKVVVNGIAIAFSSLHYFRNAPGVIYGKAWDDVNNREVEVNYSATYSNNSAFEFEWETERYYDEQYGNLDDAIIDKTRMINRALSMYENEELCTTTTDLVRKLLTPFVRPIGFSSTKYVNNDWQYSDHVTTQDTPRYYFDNVKPEDHKMFIYPHAVGATDYDGKTISGKQHVFPNDGSRFGCVGIQLFIPMTYQFIIDDDVWDSLDMIYPSTITGKCYITGGTRFTAKWDTEEETVSAHINNSTSVKTGKVYNCANKLKEFDADYLLQKSYIAMYELAAKFLKFDRQSNQLIIKDLVESGIGLYPREDIYPAQDLFPTPDDYCRISLNLWKAAWHDERKKPFYKLIKASYKDENGNDATDYFNVVDEYLLDYYEQEFPDYDISSNYFIKEGITAGTCETADIEAILENIGIKISSSVYYAVDVTMRALPYLESGDAILVLTREGGFASYTLRHRISGIQNLMDKIETR